MIWNIPDNVQLNKPPPVRDRYVPATRFLKNCIYQLIGPHIFRNEHDEWLLRLPLDIALPEYPEK